jgi:hypothetical protein
MPTSDARLIINEAIEAHGGIEYWNSLDALDVVISARGFLFTAKRRPALDHVRMRAYTHEAKFVFLDFPNPGQTAELVGNSEVRILDGNGAVITRRENPRKAFHGMRHPFKWDDPDFIYFAGYATWNYLTTPFLLNDRRLKLEALPSLAGAHDHLTRVQVTFPDDIPTHSRNQIFYFDDQRMLRRLDYTAEVVGGWAHAAHFCEKYRSFAKLKVPTHRRVLPLMFGMNKPMPGPTLVEIDVHDLKPVFRD